MKYQEGQRVKLRDDLQIGETYGGWVFTKKGEEYIGGFVTLKEWVDYDEEKGQSNGFFISEEVDLNNKSFIITYDMIDDEKSKYILKDGDSLAMAFSNVLNHEQREKVRQQPTSELLHTSNQQSKKETLSVTKVIDTMDNEENIKPAHYRKGMDDLFEAAYRTRPFSEYRAIMEFVAERYLRRMKGSPEKRIEDLNKAIYTLERLKEKEIIELEKITSLENKTLNWFSWHKEKVKDKKLSEKESILNILNLTYFSIQEEDLRLAVFKHAQAMMESEDQIDPKIYHDITRMVLNA